MLTKINMQGFTRVINVITMVIKKKLLKVRQQKSLFHLICVVQVTCRTPFTKIYRSLQHEYIID